MFFHYTQNNSGGKFVSDALRGIGPHVIIEAPSGERANKRAEQIGLYFDGCEIGKDCSCCGDRWGRVYDSAVGDETPCIWGDDAFAVEDFYAKGRVQHVGYVHYASGKIVALKEVPAR